MATLRQRGQVDPRQLHLLFMAGEAVIQAATSTVRAPGKVRRKPPEQHQRLEIDLLPEDGRAAMQDVLFKASWLNAIVDEDLPVLNTVPDAGEEAEKARDIQWLMRNLDKVAEGLRFYHLARLEPESSHAARQIAVEWFFADDVVEVVHEDASKPPTRMLREHIPFTYQWTCRVLGEPVDMLRDRVQRGLMGRRREAEPLADNPKKVAQGLLSYHLRLTEPGASHEDLVEAVEWFFADDVDSFVFKANTQQYLPVLREWIPYTYQWACRTLGMAEDDLRNCVKDALIKREAARKVQSQLPTGDSQ